MRLLRLTSPLQRGDDIKTLQAAINHLGFGHVDVDSQYGPLTKAAGTQTAYMLGCEKTDPGLPAIQKVIESPDTRSADTKKVAARRQAAAKKQGQGLAGVVKHAQQFIGVHENPAGSNKGTPYPSGWEKNFGFDGEAWCGAFAGSMILAAGGHVTSRVAYCPNIRLDAIGGANGFDKWCGTYEGVGAGWLVLYDWNGDGIADHVGIVRGFADGSVLTIEGNTSKQDDPSGSQSDGGIVAERERPINSTVMGFARPRF